MTRRQVAKYSRLTLAIFLVFCIFILATRDEKFPTALDGTSSIERTTLRPAIFKKDFCVFDHKCKIPRLNPFADEVIGIFKPPKFKECTDQRDIINVVYDVTKRQYLLHVNATLVGILYRNITAFACIYYEIVRGANDSITWKVGPVPFEQNWFIPHHINGIVVECYVAGNRSRVLQRDAFSFVQYPSGRNEQVDEARSRINPSVIMLGIDSMSQMNFQRTMPLTARFVRQLGWYEMLGYNKIGDNTLPNIMPLLTGLTSHQWRSQCNVRLPGCFDQFTYLWNHFRNAGYLTAYAEDTPSIDTFHYFTFGFIRKPVDYYLRPFLYMIQHILKTVKLFGYDYCLGRRQSYRYVFDYCLQLVQRFVQDTPKPIFGIFWSNSFSHDDFSGPASVDRDFVSYLERYKEHGLFDRAVVVLFSDHGQRQGPLMNLASSFLEERLPMLHIYLPPWYRKQYPEFAQALDVNRYRLSSTLDLHLTLKHLLVQGQAGLKLNSSVSKCQSLLEPLPENRSCEDAAIPEHWCTCDSYVQVPISNLLLYWARTVVYRINKYLASHDYAAKCAHLKLAKLLRAERKQFFDDDGAAAVPPQRIETYRIKFVTRPNGGLFRATFLADAERNVKVQEEFITRLNSYRNQSFCVSGHVAQKFCACLEANQSFTVINIDVNDQGTPC
ncbi:uncharacterized protein LOC111593782 [Drosophila hydei]|uniref:Uncharacterized protein LOC111593782 n=1 Tax=Drosophila hydei TaxID=7224 RepID=A0A6J1LBJ0_DROHY|nr:uncharacterized protein LOC111593782 [Drosophila hydei]